MEGTLNTIDFKSVVDSFIKAGKKNQQNNAFSDNRKKVMLSQTARSLFLNGNHEKLTPNLKEMTMSKFLNLFLALMIIAGCSPKKEDGNLVISTENGDVIYNVEEAQKARRTGKRPYEP